MLIQDALLWAGSQRALATLCQRSRQTIWRWGAIVPVHIAVRLWMYSRGEIDLRPEDYPQVFVETPQNGAGAANDGLPLFPTTPAEKPVLSDQGGSSAAEASSAGS
jgi:hypothetical protein